MRLNTRQRLILMGVLQDQQRLAGDDGTYHGMARDELGRRRLRTQLARDGMVPLALEYWLDHPLSNSDHVLCHRACVQLEGLGLLIRCSPFGGRRTTHLKFTPAGRRMAEQILAEEAGLAGDDIDPTIDWSKVEFLPIEMPVDCDDADECQEPAR